MSILKVDASATALFVVATVVGVTLFGNWKFVAAVTSGVLFVVGCGVFLAAYARAVQRSRTDAIGIGGLYFLAGATATTTVKRSMNTLLAVQCIVGLAGALARPYSALAFGVLVPVFGLGMNGLWAARHGVFGSRSAALRPHERETVPDRTE